MLATQRLRGLINTISRLATTSIKMIATMTMVAMLMPGPMYKSIFDLI